MITLEFVFNNDKVTAAGLTTDELLAPMREYAMKWDIEETREGFFQKEGENALCDICMFVTDYPIKDTKFVTYLDKWTLDADGEIDDCIAETYDMYREEGITV